MCLYLPKQTVLCGAIFILKSFSEHITKPVNYFLGFKDWGTASFTRPGKLRPMSWSLRLLIRSRSRFVPDLSARKTEVAVFEAFPLFVCPGIILTLNLKGESTFS